MTSLIVLSAALVACLVGMVFLGLRLAQSQKEASRANLTALREEFAALASQALDQKTRDLSLHNAENVRPLFDQLKEKFSELKIAAENATKANVVLGVNLRTKLDEVGAKAQDLGRQADEFVTALKGGNKIQGNWGEGILAKVLEDAGLVRNVNFVEQMGARDAGLPDVTVFDGAHRKILIDAKVNIVHFISASNAAKEGRMDIADQERLEHAKSVRLQIRGLAERRYPVRMKDRDPDPAADYSEIVVMMMPSEATYAAAVIADPSLVAYANGLRVVLASPQMLFGYLVLFKAGFDRLQIDRHHQDLARCAQMLIERMDAAFAALEEVGDALGKAEVAYHRALGKLGGETNPQNLLVPTREIVRLAGYTGRLKSETLRA